jgi:fructose-specific component phosphotransferase system IIB-like protein
VRVVVPLPVAVDVRRADAEARAEDIDASDSSCDGDASDEGLAVGNDSSLATGSDVCVIDDEKEMERVELGLSASDAEAHDADADADVTSSLGRALDVDDADAILADGRALPDLDGDRASLCEVLTLPEEL